MGSIAINRVVLRVKFPSLASANGTIMIVTKRMDEIIAPILGIVIFYY